MPEWTPEVELDEALVRSLLAAQFPHLALDALRRFAEGWDNALWAVGDGLVFRFPRRAIAVPGVEREIRLLGRLAPRLPLPIPDPIHVGVPSDAFPWPFSGARLLPGREIAHAGRPGAAAPSAFGASLGAFLRALHAPALADELGEGLADDPMGRADMAVRVPRTRDRLAQLAAAGLWIAPPPVEPILAAALELPPASASSLVHGDLHVRHVLVDEQRLPAAVIDWGDACLADPSVDLALYWSLLDDDGRAAFRAAYGDAGLTPGRLLRARVLALFLDAVLALYALDTGDEALRRQALAGLDRTLTG